MKKRIIETRRIFYYKKETSWEYKYIKNPVYDSQTHKRLIHQGYSYHIKEFIEKEIPVTIRKKHSHVEYRIKCDYCKGTSGWVRRKDAKFCSPSCRKLSNKIT